MLFFGRVFVILIVLYLLACVWLLFSGFWKYTLCPPLDLAKRYGPKTWVVITGASRGQGKCFAHEFASRGFSLILIGSLRCEMVRNELVSKYPEICVKVIVCDFSYAMQDSYFFHAIEREFYKHEVSILINNVGQRYASLDYLDMPVEKMKAVIATGTYVQARLTQIALARFIKRQCCYKSAIINITAQCIHPTFGLGSLCLRPEISMPYVSVYEAANAFGFYHGQSIAKEYAHQDIDVMNIMPGAVLTEKTHEFLHNTPFAVTDHVFVKNIIRMMGRVQGATCGVWQHEVSGWLINFAPWMKQGILYKTGKRLAQHYSQHTSTVAS